MIRSKNSNEVVWNEVYTHSKLPHDLAKLEELARNIWWVWTSEVRKLFAEIDEEKWEASQANPIEILNSLSSAKQEELLQNKDFMARLDKAYQRYQEYLWAQQCAEDILWWSWCIGWRLPEGGKRLTR